MQIQVNFFFDKLTMEHCPFFVVEVLPVCTYTHIYFQQLLPEHMLLVRIRRLLKSSSVQKTNIKFKKFYRQA